jgi:hypothetical protein
MNRREFFASSAKGRSRGAAQSIAPPALASGTKPARRLHSLTFCVAADLLTIF